ncbi:MAG: hypothetical protein ABI569_12070 [Casimicrobiaceae bacterium]
MALLLVLSGAYLLRRRFR